MGAAESAPENPSAQQRRILSDELERAANLTYPPQSRAPVQRSNSADHVKKLNLHFSDFSLYPDRFVATPTRPVRPHVRIDEDSGGSAESSPKMVAAPPPSMAATPTVVTPGGVAPGITKYNYRFRSFSQSESDSTHFSHSFAGKSALSSPGEQHTPELFPGSLPGPGGQFRQRAHSQGSGKQSSSPSNSRLYFFDYSMIPEKDPKCAARIKEEELRDSSLTSTGSSNVSSNTPSITISPPGAATSAPIPPASSADSADMAAAQKAREEIRKSAGNQGRRVRKYSAPTKYSFFDYSMIPDKMEPAMVKKNTASVGRKSPGVTVSEEAEKNIK